MERTKTSWNNPNLLKTIIWYLNWDFLYVQKVMPRLISDTACLLFSKTVVFGYKWAWRLQLQALQSIGRILNEKTMAEEVTSCGVSVWGLLPESSVCSRWIWQSINVGSFSSKSQFLWSIVKQNFVINIVFFTWRLIDIAPDHFIIVCKNTCKFSWACCSEMYHKLCIFGETSSSY